MFMVFNKNEDQIEEIIKKGNINELRNLVKQIQENEDKFKNSWQEIPNLVISACRNDKIEILKYLLANDGKVLNQIYVTKTNIPSPDDTDKWQHNAFYYAIRSSNIELLDTLITAWPGSVLSNNNSEMLDNILSKAFEEIRIKNILLSDEMKIFVESQLIDIQFLSDKTEIPSKEASQSPLNNIKERISFIVEKIALLNEEFAVNEQEINERFFFIAKCIAQNIYVLKRQLKSTYAILPWEEIEFCLICFISLHKTQHEINIFYHSTLSKAKLLKYLNFFAEKLHEIGMTHLETIEIRKIAELPKLSRPKVVANILLECPQFKELYDVHQHIRDIHSLTKMNEYIKLSRDIDPKQKEGRLVISRTLQIVGEHFKNSLESPKLSDATNAILLFSLSNETKRIIIGLRNSLTHSNSLLETTNIQKNNDVKFFIGIQKDCKKLGGLIADILHTKKVNLIRVLLKKLLDTNNSSEQVREISKTLRNCFNLEDIEMGNFRSENQGKIEKLFNEFRSSVTLPTNYETEMFQRIDNLIKFEKRDNVKNRALYIETCSLFKMFHVCVEDKSDFVNFKKIESLVNQIIDEITPDIEEEFKYKSIGLICTLIFKSCKSRMQNDEEKLKDLYTLVTDINFISTFGKNDVKFIKELEQKINKQFSAIKLDDHICSPTNSKFKEELKHKLNELKDELDKILDTQHITEIHPFYKSNKKLQAIIELLVLDILNILSVSKTCVLKNNFLSFNENSPLLIGKSLRNHLAHDNKLVDLLIADPSISIVLNANKLVTENITDDKKIMGKICKEDLGRIKNNYKRGLKTVDNQIEMLKTLQYGNFEDFLSCLENGSDIFARCFRMRTTLHYAAIGGCLEIVQYLYNQNVPANVRDLDSKTALHIAAEYGKTNVVEYLLSKQINSLDEETELNETPLHLAAGKGHKDTVECLLLHKSSTIKCNFFGLVPLQKAVLHGHKDVIEVFLRKEFNAKIVNGLNLLHLASISGSPSVVNYLLERKINVNANSFMGGKTPLHLAAQHGHLIIVNILIENKAKVNSIDNEGCAPIHFAAENGHEKIFNALLKHGAKINAVDVKKHTPLHYAIKNKNEQIVNICLNRSANASLSTLSGQTPLHYAIELGNFNIINALLGHGVNTNCKDQNGHTPLHILAGLEFSSYSKIVELLLNNGAEINAKNNSHCTPLHIACFKGNIDVIESLVTNGADINARNNNNETPLERAAFKDKIDAVKILVKNKALVNTKNKNGLTPLFHAASNGCSDIVEYLLENKAVENKNITPDFIAINSAITLGHDNVVRILLKYRSKINDRGMMDGSTLSLATIVGNIKIVQTLIEHGVNVNPKGMGDKSPLCCAINLNRKEIVRLLVSNGANVDGEVGEPIYTAIFDGHVDIVEYLLSKKARINTKLSGKNLLNIAVTRGHTEVVRALIRHGADVNGADSKDVEINKNFSPLYLAIMQNNKDIIKILIENGANINQKSIDGTPIHSAVYTNNLECLKLMIESGNAKLNSKADNDFTILLVAAENGYLEIVKYLIENGSDIHAKTASHGSKAIHLAAKYGFKSTVEILLRSGLSVNETSLINQTPLHYASQSGQLEVAKYLISKNACIDAQDTCALTPLHLAANSGHRNVVELLLHNGSMHNAMAALNRTPLILATNLEIRNLLISTANLFKAVKENNCTNVHKSLKKGAIINSRNNKGLTPLCRALELHHFDIVKVLLINGATYDPSNDNHLTSIDSTKHKDIIELLQQAKRPINKGNMENVFPPFADYGMKSGQIGLTFKNADQVRHLSYIQHVMIKKQTMLSAITTGNEQILKELISSGSDVNEVISDGRAPLHFAVHSEHINVVNILLANGAYVTQVTNKGNTPLHTAVSKNNKEIVDILLRNIKSSELKEFINTKTTTSGSTALHVAVAKNGSLDIVKLLLKYGAAYDITNQKDEIPFQLATDQQVKCLLKLIQELSNYIRCGNSKALQILKKLNDEEFSIATNSRNNQGSTLLQLAIVHENKTIAKHLIEILKIRNEIESPPDLNLCDRISQKTMIPFN